MTVRLSVRTAFPSERFATPVSILQTVSEALGKIETAADKEGVKPLWDTLTLEMGEDFIEDDYYTVADHRRYVTKSLIAALLAADPKEVAE